jgi:hypothetical protein
MKKHEPGVCNRITAGRNLQVRGIQWRKWVLPDSDHDASPVPPRILDQPCLTEVPFLLATVPVGTVILHHQHPTVRCLEHHVEPDRPGGESTLVAMAGSNHIVEQREDLALKLGCCLIPG